MVEILVHSAILIVSTALTWIGSDALERAADRLAIRYRLPAIVQGSLIVAVGSSFPELATTIISSAVHGEFALGMSALVGSAIFNILVIPGISRLVSDDLTFDMRLVYRDAQFYLTSVAVLLLAFSFALIYEPVDGRALTGELTRPLALIPLALYGLYLFLQHQESRGNRGGPPPESDAGLAEGSGNVSGPAWKDWLLLTFGLVLVLIGVEGLLRTALWLGETLDTANFIWGATVVAAATSLPDMLISIRAARANKGDVSIGNVIGSNVFDLLVAIPAGILVAGAAVIDYAVAAPLMAVLTFATIVLFTAMRTDFRLTRLEAWILLALYAAFLAWLMLETFGVVGVLGDAVRER